MSTPLIEDDTGLRQMGLPFMRTWCDPYRKGWAHCNDRYELFSPRLGVKV